MSKNAKVQVTKNKADDIETKPKRTFLKPRTEESILAEKFGNLQIEIDTLVSMARKVQGQQDPIRLKLLAIKQAKRTE